MTNIEFIKEAIDSRRAQLAEIAGKSETIKNQGEQDIQITFPNTVVITEETFIQDRLAQQQKKQAEQEQRDIESAKNSEKNYKTLKNSGIIDLFEGIENSKKLKGAKIDYGFENRSISLNYENDEQAPFTNGNGRTNLNKTVVLHALDDGTVGEINYIKRENKKNDPKNGDGKNWYEIEQKTIYDPASYVTQKIVNDLDN